MGSAEQYCAGIFRKKKKIQKKIQLGQVQKTHKQKKTMQTQTLALNYCG